MSAVSSVDFDDLARARGMGLEELVDRAQLGELCDSFFRLFRVPARVFAEGVGPLVSAGDEPELHAYLRRSPVGRRRLDEATVEVANLSPPPGESRELSTFSGAVYHVVPIDFEQRRMGRIVLGPYLPVQVKSVPAELATLDPGLDPRQIKRLLASLPRAKEETIREISLHLTRTLDLILYGGHRALLTSSLHVMSMKESFLELEDRNRRLESALLRLQELDRLKSDFLATISHELRTPLTSVIGYSEMLKEGLFGSLSPPQLETMSIIHAKGSQLLELIVGLVDLSKMERGSLQLSHTPVDVSELILDVVATVKPIALEAEVGLECRVAEGTGTVMGDLARLRQVFLNLLDNAVKFTPASGRVTITATHGWIERQPEDDAVVVLTARQPAVVVTVCDTGIGIADEEKPRVFDPFYQVDSGTTRKKGGTGLGLSIVRRLVEAHRGAVRIEDPPSGGTAFVVTLPRQRASFS